LNFIADKMSKDTFVNIAKSRLKRIQGNPSSCKKIRFAKGLRCKPFFYPSRCGYPILRRKMGNISRNVTLRTSSPLKTGFHESERKMKRKSLKSSLIFQYS
jgi:hypothetical protein